eukprot:942735-Rhodomonas_salina.3
MLRFNFDTHNMNTTDTGTTTCTLPTQVHTHDRSSTDLWYQGLWSRMALLVLTKRTVVLGIVASHYYVKYASLELYNELVHPGSDLYLPMPPLPLGRY